MHRGEVKATPLLVVEDDRELGDLLVELFTGEGYQVELARDGQRGLHLALTRDYRVLIIDRGLPAVDGLDLLVRLRRQAVTVPVLVLTAMGTVADRVAGLDAGAEDYLVKPFEVDELLARVRALHRRHLDRAARLPLGDGWLDLDLRTAVTARGDHVTLAGREFALLRELAGQPRQVYSREQLRELLFPEAQAASIVDTYVYYLRRKLGRSVVRTVHGVGYRIGEA